MTRAVRGRGIAPALLAAALYALNAPLSKLLLADVTPFMMAAFLYLGAGAGLAGVGLARRLTGRAPGELPLTRAELPFTLLMVALDTLAPVLLMLGLARTDAASAALLSNFEIVATALLALCFFGERIPPRLWLAVALMTAASILLSLRGGGRLRFSSGSLLILAACACWGLENNCTRRLSAKDPLEIVVVKGFGSGAGALLLGLLLGERLPAARYAAAALLLGFVAYGLSIYFYVYAQRALGAARTSAFYAVAPFLGAGLSFLLCGEKPGPLFLAALPLMLAGAYFASWPAGARRRGGRG